MTLLPRRPTILEDAGASRPPIRLPAHEGRRARNPLGTSGFAAGWGQLGSAPILRYLPARTASLRSARLPTLPQGEARGRASIIGNRTLE